MEIGLLEKDDTRPSDKAKEKVANGIKWTKAGQIEPASFGMRPISFMQKGMPSLICLVSVPSCQGG